MEVAVVILVFSALEGNERSGLKLTIVRQYSVEKSLVKENTDFIQEAWNELRHTAECSCQIPYTNIYCLLQVYLEPMRDCEKRRRRNRMARVGLDPIRSCQR